MICVTIHYFCSTVIVDYVSNLFGGKKNSEVTVYNSITVFLILIIKRWNSFSKLEKGITSSFSVSHFLANMFIMFYQSSRKNITCSHFFIFFPNHFLDSEASYYWLIQKQNFLNFILVISSGFKIKLNYINLSLILL